MTLKQRLGKLIYRNLPFSRRTFSILRMESHFACQRWLNACLPWRRLHIKKLRNQRGIKLNVGSGGRGHPGWINLDASSHHADVYCTHDLRRALPLADGSVKGLLAEHVIEHLDFKDDVPRVLAEFHRVLEPGGVARIVVPDAERFMRAYLAGGANPWAELGFVNGLPGDMDTPIELVNHTFHQGGEHCFGWDFQAMDYILRKAGFTQVIRQCYGQSTTDYLAIDQPNHAQYSLYVEAVK